VLHATTSGGILFRSDNVVCVCAADATLTFETELMSLNKKSAASDLFFRILRFLVVPVGIICAVYYVYNKNRKVPSKREAARRKKR